MICNFNEAWIGKCENESPCEKHANQTCASCGAQATHDCEQTGQFVCGSPLCDECEHAIAPDGTNAGIGFFSTIPDEMIKTWKSHIKKTDQKYDVWWKRKAT